MILFFELIEKDTCPPRETVGDDSMVPSIVPDVYGSKLSTSILFLR